MKQLAGASSVRLVGLVIGLAISSVACGGPSGTPFDVSQVAEGEPILTYVRDVGECSSACAGSTLVFIDGRVEQSRFDGVVWEEQYEDLDGLLDDLAATSAKDLVLGDDDCGREVDGTGDLVSFAGEEIDTCLVDIDREHRLMQRALTVSAVPEWLEPLTMTAVGQPVERPAPWQRLADEARGPWPDSLSPNKCGELYAEAERVNGKTGFIAVAPNGDACEVWSDEIGNDPDDVCRIPRSYPAEVDVLVHPEGFFICPGR